MSLSLTPDETIIFDVRMGYNVIGYSSDNYFGLHVKFGESDPECGSMITIHRSFPMGLYSWVGRLRDIAVDVNYWWGFEFTHGNPVYGIICFTIINGAVICQTINHNGLEKNTNIGVYDFSEDTVFSINWSSSQVTFLINGLEVARHFPPYIPTKDMPFFFEACRGYSVTHTSFIEVKAESFEDYYTPPVDVHTHEPHEPVTHTHDEYPEHTHDVVDNTFLYVFIGVIVVMIIVGVIALK